MYTIISSRAGAAPKKDGSETLLVADILYGNFLIKSQRL